MNIDHALDTNAITLGALRNMCLEFDNSHAYPHPVELAPAGLAVFSSAVRRALHRSISEEEFLFLTDTAEWYKALNELKETCILQSVLKLRVEAVEEIPAEEEDDDVPQDKLAVSCTDATLEVLKEGADPEDPNSWVPVSNIASVKLGGANEAS
jgi:hypothetical protein